MASPDDPLSIAILVSSRLARVGVAHMLTGAAALAVHAEPRMSREIELVADLGALHIPRLLTAFESDFDLDEVALHDAVATRRAFHLVHEVSGWLLGVSITKDDPFDRVQLSRRIEARLGDIALPFVSREDLILTKLQSSKDTGSELDRRDVASLILTAPSLDTSHLERWARHLGVHAELRAGLGR